MNLKKCRFCLLRIEFEDGSWQIPTLTFAHRFKRPKGTLLSEILPKGPSKSRGYRIIGFRV